MAPGGAGPIGPPRSGEARGRGGGFSFHPCGAALPAGTNWVSGDLKAFLVPRGEYRVASEIKAACGGRTVCPEKP